MCDLCVKSKYDKIVYSDAFPKWELNHDHLVEYDKYQIKMKM